MATQTGSIDLKGLKVAGDDAKAAMTSASGKNTIYRAAVQPSSNLVEGDVWFDSANDNKIYRYTNGAWTAVALGDDALDNLSANKITTGTLDASQVTVSNLDAGNITTGTLNAERIGANTLTLGKMTTETQAAIENSLIEIGGRNLFSWPETGTKWKDEEHALNTYQNVGSFTQFNNSLQFDPSETVGEKYTISFWAKSPNGSTALHIYNSNNKPKYFYFASVELTSNLGNTWQYFETTVVNAQYTGSSPSTNERYWRRIEIYAPSQTGVLVKKIKVEKGNKATDWSPAPEDVDAAIAEKKSIHTIQTSNSLSYANILTYSNDGYNANWWVSSTNGIKAGDTVRMKVTVSDMSDVPVYIVGEVISVNSSTVLNITSHGLDTTVIDGGRILANSIGAGQIATNSITADKIQAGAITIGKIDQSDADTALAILNSSIEVSGRNLLLGSVQYQKNTPYTLTTTAKDGYKYLTDVYTNVVLESGQKYIIQAKTDGVWAASHGEQSTQYVTLWLVLGTTKYIASYHICLTAPSTNVYAKCIGDGIWEFTCPAGYAGCYVWLRINNYNTDNTTSVTHKYWDFKFEKGNVATEWSIAPEDQMTVNAGGRNLLLWTDSLKKGTDKTVNGKDGIAGWSSNDCLTQTEDGIKLTVPNTSDSECIGIPLASNGSVGNNERVILTFEARGNITSVGRLFWLQSSGGNIAMSNWLFGGSSITLNTTNWTKFTTEVTNAQANIRTCTRILLFYGLGSTNVGKWIELKKGTVKLEKGTIPTPWSPAPEESVSLSQRIYYRTTSNQKPSAPTTWINASDTNTYNAWSTKVAPLAATTAAGQTQYPFLWTCEQRRAVNGLFLGTTEVQLDQNTTVISGGQIITNSITANQIAANTLTLGNINQSDAATSEAILNSSIVIGGKNLLGGTDNSKPPSTLTSDANRTFGDSACYNTPPSSISIEAYDGSSNAFTATETATGNRGIGWYTNNGVVAYGETVTFSCMVWSSLATTVHTHTAWRNSSATAIYTGWTSSGSKSITANMWTEYSYTFTCASAYPAYEFMVALCFTGNESGLTWKVAHAKLERGNKVTDWSPAPEDQNVDDIQIGGRNLLLGTQDFSGRTSGVVTVGTDTYNSCVIASYTNSSSSYADLVIWGNKVTPDPNTYYTLSFWAKASAACDIYSYFYSTTVESGYNSSGNTTISGDGGIATTLSTNWERYWITWKTRSDVSGNKSIIPMRVMASVTGTFYIAGVMFEQGNKASNWSPAPEDVDNQIAGLSSYKQINTTSRSFTTANWKYYGTVDLSVTWSTGSSFDNSHIRVGDTAYILGTVSDGVGGSAAIVGTVTAVNGVNGSSSITMASKQLLFGGDSVDNAAKTATNYLHFTSGTGLDVGYTDTQAKTRITGSGVSIYANDTTNYATVDSNGMKVYKGGDQVAQFGSIVLLGDQTSDSKIVLDPTGDTTSIRIPLIDSGTQYGYLLLDKDGLFIKVPGSSVGDETYIQALDGSIYSRSQIRGKGGVNGPFCQGRGSSSSVSIGSNWTQVPLVAGEDGPGEFYNWENLFGNVNSGIKVYCGGLYKVTAGVYFSSYSSATRVGAAVLKGSTFANATEQCASLYYIGGSSAATIITAGPQIVELADNDILYLAGRTVSGTGTVNAAAKMTYMLIERITNDGSNS